jgi:hypothetical protein
MKAANMARLEREANELVCFCVAPNALSDALADQIADR